MNRAEWIQAETVDHPYLRLDVGGLELRAYQYPHGHPRWCAQMVITARVGGRADSVEDAQAAAEAHAIAVARGILAALGAS